MNKNIMVISGDGIGPEITAEGVKVLKTVLSALWSQLYLRLHTGRGCAIDLFGEPLPEEPSPPV